MIFLQLLRNKKWMIGIVILFISSSIIAETVFLPTRNPFLLPASSVSSVKSIDAIKTVWIKLYFARARDVVRFISKKSSHILSQQGKINYDERDNQVWLQDDAEHIGIIRALIHHLDKPNLQFLIQARIINLDRQYQQTLGLLFHEENVAAQPVSSGLNMNEPQDTGSGEFTFAIARLSDAHILNLQLSALEQEGHASLISSPELLTLENTAAVIQSGDEVPYQEATSSGATSVSFKKALLRLKVTPIRMPNDHILLNITVNQDKVIDLTVNGVPAIQTQQISTQVVVRNHQTIVLGGILETTHEKQKEGIPIIDQLPLIGQLVTRHHVLTKQQELLIFITPSMMKPLS